MVFLCSSHHDFYLPIILSKNKHFEPDCIFASGIFGNLQFVAPFMPTHERSQTKMTIGYEFKKRAIFKKNKVVN